jgi:type I restriction enzyme S subunit
MGGAGSTRAYIGITDQLALPIVIPPLNVQENIVSILGVIDDKIALNKKMNATLEQMAQALFKSWFVDFDPVKAKAAGLCPEGMDAETAMLFPSELEESELGQVPKGWRISTIDQATELIIDHRGKTPKKLNSEWSLNGIPAVSAKNIKAGRMVQKNSMNFVSEELYDRWMKDKLASGDILMTSEAPLGELFYIARNPQLCLSQRIFALRSKPELCLSAYLYVWLGSSEARSKIDSRATGTTVVGIRQTELRKVEVVLPPIEIQAVANKFFHYCLVKIDVNEEEIECLTSIRDALLPKLISGQLRMPGAEKIAEVAL